MATDVRTGRSDHSPMDNLPHPKVPIQPHHLGSPPPPYRTLSLEQPAPSTSPLNDQLSIPGHLDEHRAKTSRLTKDSARKSRSQSASRSKEVILTPKKAEINLQEVPRTSRTAQSILRFGQLSHNSFFSRHNPHPNRVSHIQDLSGKPICTVRDYIIQAPPSVPPLLPKPSPHFSVSMVGGVPRIQMPIGDPQSLLEPRFSLSSMSDGWREELKELASRVAAFSKEAEVKKKEKEETERLSRYSPETGRLIPSYTRAMTSRGPRTAQKSSNLWNKDMAPVVQDQELLILELLCQILQTDSLTAIQYWLVSAGPREKDLVLGLLQTAVAQLIPQPLISLPEERIMTARAINTSVPHGPTPIVKGLIPQKSPRHVSKNRLKAKPEPVPPCEKPGKEIDACGKKRHPSSLGSSLRPVLLGSPTSLPGHVCQDRLPFVAEPVTGKQRLDQQGSHVNASAMLRFSSYM